ncbi:MAG: protein kinase domain-containing protein [Planctomycetota bacterium]|jgi:serine/threonine-protein kinase
MSDDRSILARMESDGRAVPRVRLRVDDPESAPVLRRNGRYEVLGELAVGGVGEVWKGRDIDLCRDVALKVLRDRHAENPELIQRFAEEAQIGGQLQHPGVVPIYELGLQSDDRPFFAMKLVKGQTLAALLAERKEVGEKGRRFLQVFEHACQTIAYSHSRGVIHRDLKPSNVMVGAFGEVQILDWGFAKVLRRGGIADERKAKRTAHDVTKIATLRSHGEGSESIAGSIMGTPAYMPPEQALGLVEELDERSDVFALGAILCEILTGAPPYVSESSNDVLLMAAQADLGDALARLDDCAADRELAKLVRHCLSPRRTDRPRNASEVAERVGRHLAQAEERAHRSALEAAQARADAKHEQLEAAQQRRARRLSLLLGSAVVVLVMVGVGAFAVLDRAEREHARRVNGAVADAIRAAQQLRGEQRWGPALVALEQVRELALADGVDERTRSRAHAIDREIGEEAERAQANELRRQAEEEFVAKLEAIRLGRGDMFDSTAVDAEYLQAFREFGVDPERGDASENAGLIRMGERSREIAAALDDWAWLRRTKEDLAGSDWRRIATIARLADPDEWRNRLRSAVESVDSSALRALAAEMEESLPVRTKDLVAIALKEAGETRAAVDLLRPVALRHPDDFWVHYHLSAWYRAIDPPDSDAAIRHARCARALRPGSAAAWGQLALSLESAGRIEDAARAFMDVIASHPDYQIAYNDYGLLFDRAGRLDEAIQCYRVAIRHHPGMWSSYDNLRRLYEFEKKDVEAAIAVMESFPREEPSWHKAHHALGNLYKRNGRYPQAIAAYRAVLKERPQYSGTHCMLGSVLVETGDLEDAERHLRESIRLRRTSTAHLELSRVYFRTGRSEQAVEECRKGLKLNPAATYGNHNLGSYHLSRGEWELAIAAFEKELALRPNLAVSHAGLAGAKYWGHGDIRTAVESMRRAVELGHPRAHVLRRWERHLALVDQLPDIRAGKKQPDSAQDAIDLSMVLYLKKRHVEALRFSLDAFEREPGLIDDLAESHRHNAACMAALAGTGQGVDAADADESQRKAWRARALAWKRADLQAYRRGERQPLVDNLTHWQQDPDLAFVREHEHLARLPKPEAEQWHAFWRDVQAALDEQAKRR